jgi:curved DNA-binding protein CbpA
MAHAPEDPYEVLGVPPTATQEEINRAYRRLVREHHPDLHPHDPANPTAQQSSSVTGPLRRVLNAYALLRDPVRRDAYDRSAGLKRPQSRRSSPYFRNPQPEPYIRDLRPEGSVWVGPVRFDAAPPRRDARSDERALFDDLLTLLLRHFRGR